MPIGSILSKFKEVKLSTADNKTYFVRMNFVTKTAIKFLGIPHIGFRTRARIIFKLFKQIGKHSRILDAGCGYGIYSIILAEKGYTIDSLDIEEERINELNSMKEQYKKIDSKIKTAVGTLLDLPYENETFNIVVCSEVIEHIENDDRAFSELSRILRKGGLLILSVPLNSASNKKTYKRFGHQRPGYRIEELKNLSKEKGLKIETIKCYQYLFGRAAFEAHYVMKNKILLGLCFYLFYLFSFLDVIFKVKEPNAIVALFRKV